eukprot:TRINITY_DN70125_c0_g1_i1.p1 TRINITY_DN70125_c0_g1~~TRINITY_DN70125_c0_g1_i1.p1  ORF type:complete len:368 (+),score=127.80 TRINITY_DN70125_c0_g1_i1:92-1105(+)
MESVAPQNLSLMRVFQPRIRQLEQYLTQHLRGLEDIPTWDPNNINHSALLVSIKHIRAQEEKWRRTQGHLMVSLWLEQTKRYNIYRHSMVQFLQRRHTEELGFLFPQLRVATWLDSLGSAGNEKDDEPKGKAQLAKRDHLRSLGFRYTKRLKKLDNLVTRQLEERGHLDKTVQRHLEALQAGQEADLERLAKGLKRVQALVEQCANAAEQKITLSHQQTMAPSLYRRPPQRERTGLTQEPGQVRPPPAAQGPDAAPVGSAMDRPLPGAAPADPQLAAAAGDAAQRASVAAGRPPSAAPAAAPAGEQPKALPGSDEYERELQDILQQATRPFDGASPG